MKYIKIIATITLCFTTGVSLYSAEHPNLLEMFEEESSDLGILEEMDCFLGEQRTNKESSVETPEDLGSWEHIVDQTSTESPVIEELSSDLDDKRSSTKSIQNLIETIQCKAIQFPDDIVKSRIYQCNECVPSKYFDGGAEPISISNHLHRKHDIDIKDITNKHFNMRLRSGINNYDVLKLKCPRGHWALSNRYNRFCNYCTSIWPVENNKPCKRNLHQISIEKPALEPLSSNSSERKSSTEPTQRLIDTIQCQAIQFPDSISKDTPMIEQLSSDSGKEKSLTEQGQPNLLKIFEEEQFDLEGTFGNMHDFFEEQYINQGNPVKTLKNMSSRKRTLNQIPTKISTIKQKSIKKTVERIQCEVVQFPDSVPSFCIYRCNECMPPKHLAGSGLEHILSHLNCQHYIETKDITNKHFSTRLRPNIRHYDVLKIKYLCGHWTLSKRYSKPCSVCKYVKSLATAQSPTSHRRISDQISIETPVMGLLSSNSDEGKWPTEQITDPPNLLHASEHMSFIQEYRKRLENLKKIENEPKSSKYTEPLSSNLNREECSAKPIQHPTETIRCKTDHLPSNTPENYIYQHNECLPPKHWNGQPLAITVFTQGQEFVEKIHCKAIQFPNSIPKDCIYRCNECISPKYLAGNSAMHIVRHLQCAHDIEIKDITDKHFSVRSGTSSEIFKIKYSCGHHTLSKRYNKRCNDCRDLRFVEDPENHLHKRP